MHVIQLHPAVLESTSLAMNVAGNDEYNSREMSKLVDGMKHLQNPPLEAYVHISLQNHQDFTYC
jgi:hypothetical protein